eukprot:51265-Chlamydomonas_euryale.AAC.1
MTVAPFTPPSFPPPSLHARQSVPRRSRMAIGEGHPSFGAAIPQCSGTHSVDPHFGDMFHTMRKVKKLIFAAGQGENHPTIKYYCVMEFHHTVVLRSAWVARNGQYVLLGGT